MNKAIQAHGQQAHPTGGAVPDTVTRDDFPLAFPPGLWIVGACLLKNQI